VETTDSQRDKQEMKGGTANEADLGLESLPESHAPQKQKQQFLQTERSHPYFTQQQQTSSPGSPSQKLSGYDGQAAAFLQLQDPNNPFRNDIETFKKHLKNLIAKINESESEEFHKNLMADFLKNTYYSSNHFINTKGRNDLVIHNGKDSQTSVGVILECKKPTNKSEMLKVDNLNTKALQELVLYFLRERLTAKNLEIKYLIATNIYEWFIFDANIFEKAFIENKTLVQQFTDFEAGRLSNKKNRLLLSRNC